MTEKNIPVNNTPAEITEIMPKSFKLGDSSLIRYIFCQNNTTNKMIEILYNENAALNQCDD